jgi:GTP-binding protein YchF
MSLKIGIVGLPNVGKSTLFNALLKKSQALAANYPFATIDPNVGVVPVPDKRLDKLAALYNPPSIVSATIEFVDIAGLVKDAAKGEGLGNQFLSHIREVDAIVHVLREFGDANVIHVEGRVDPTQDMKIIQTELLLADLAVLQKAQRPPKGTVSKEEQFRQQAIDKALAAVEQGNAAELQLLADDEQASIKDLNLLSLKPVIYVHNVDEAQLVEDRSDTHQLPPGHMHVCAQIEAELASLSDEDRAEYLKELGVERSGLDKVIAAAYDLLGLMSFLTAGDKEVRAWTIRKGAKAPQAAGEIHSDFENKFIRAEAINWQELIEAGGWTEAKAKGLVRMEGKDYVIQDGDVLVIHHS